MITILLRITIRTWSRLDGFDDCFVGTETDFGFTTIHDLSENILNNNYRNKGDMRVS